MTRLGTKQKLSLRSDQPSETSEMLERLIRVGSSIARLNFSHGANV